MRSAEPTTRAQKEVLVTGDQQSGWSPAAGEQAVSSRAVLLNIEIQFDGSGYLLCYASDDGLLWGDTWHISENEAKQVALEEFGVQPHEWRQA
jgi:hypothetical protein